MPIKKVLFAYFIICYLFNLLNLIIFLINLYLFIYFRKLDIACFDVSSLLVNQIKEWSTETCHGKSQRCLYSVSEL